MEFLCLLLFALIVVTLVGHGIWVALAAAFRALSQEEPERSRVDRKPSAARCLACGTRLHEGDHDCPACGLARHGETAEEVRELNAALRQLRGLVEREEVDRAAAAPLLDALVARKRTLLREEVPATHVETVRIAPVPLPVPRPPVAAEQVLDVVPVVEETAPPTPIPFSTPAVPADPPRTLGTVLGSFMEQSNILWGELVGGLLIVGCSIALVLTLWNSLQKVPYFPFLLFTALTGALYLAGRYTLSHWNLASTSRGLLLIALMLTPLNLLVLADPSARGAAVVSPWVDVLVDLAALALFTAITYAAGRSLIGEGLLAGPIDRRWLLAVAVVGSPGCQLLAQYLFTTPLDGAPVVAWHVLACLAVACVVIPGAAVLAGLTVYGRRDEGLHREQANAVFCFLGLATFALLAAFGFLLTRLGTPLSGLRALAAPLALAGAPVVALGLLVVRRLAADQPEATRTAGTAVALGGLGLMALAVGLAWPAPGPLLVTLLLTGAVVGTATFAANAPWAHAGAVPALALACVVAYHLAVGHLPSAVHANPSQALLAYAASADSAALLAGFASALAALAAWLTRPSLVSQGVALGRAALGIGIVALLLATAHGVERPLTAAAVHGVCAATALLATLRWPRAYLATLGTVVLVPGTLWALWGWDPGQLHVWGFTLAGEALALQLAGAWLTRRWLPEPGAAGQRVALLAGALAVSLPLYVWSFPPPLLNAGTALVLAAALLARALDRQEAGWFAGFQIALIGAVGCAVTTLVEPRGWFADVRCLQAYGVGLGLLCLAGELARRRCPGHLWEAFAPGVDRALLAVLVVGQVILAVVAAWGASLAEWGQLGGANTAAHFATAHEPGGWLLLGVLAMPLLVQLRGPARDGEETLHQAAVVELLLLLVCVPLLWASWHSLDLAGASAARWGLAACFLAGSALLWGRDALRRATAAAGFVQTSASGMAYPFFAFVAAAVVILTAILSGLGFSGERLPGPLAESVFARMGPIVSSVGPLLLVVLGLVGTAVRERWTGYALAAGLLLPISGMGGYALGVVRGGHALDDGQVVLMLLLGCQLAAAAALVWLTGRHWVGTGMALALQSWLGLVGMIVLTALALPGLLSAPGTGTQTGLAVFGDGFGWLALALAAGAAWWHSHLEAPPRRIHVAGWAVLVVGALAASFARQWDSVSPWWVSYQVLAGVWVAIAIGLIVGGSLLAHAGWNERVLPSRTVRRWLVVLAVVLTVVGLRGALHINVLPVVPAACVLAASSLLGGVALWFLLGGYAHASGLLFTLAVFLGWNAWGPDEPLVGALMVPLGLATSAAFWWAVETPRLREGRPRLAGSGLAYAPVATGASLTLLTLLTLTVLLGRGVGATATPEFSFAWVVAAMVGLALYLAAQSGRQRLALPGLYGLGLVVAGLATDSLAASPAQLGWIGTVALAAHVLLASIAVRAWQAWVKLPTAEPSALALQVPVLPEREWAWFFPAQIVAACVVVILGLGDAVAQLTLALRLAGPTAIALSVGAFWLLSEACPAPTRERLRLGSLALGVVALAGLAWALPDPLGAVPWLTRNAYLLVGLTAAALAGLELLTAWPAGRRLALVIAGVAVALIVVVLLQMVPVFDPAVRRTPLGRLGVVGVALAVAALLGGSLRLALRGDPLGSSENARTWYVYLAEALALALFVHVRLNVPELFHGTLVRYWTFIVLGLAFGVVGLGEWAERRGLRVLALPLLRTGVLLPLAPILAFWARPPEALLEFAADHAPGLVPFLGYLHALPWNFDAHALVWLFTSALFAALGLARRSWAWGLAAAVAGNFGFWALLMHSGVSFFVHPQAWIIPLALILLIAEHLHRDRLRPELSESLRYLGVSMIYVASVGDLFLVGLGSSLWMPIVLACLCVAGVLAGILLRVRAFLFLGVAFLLVDVLAMIWHAAVARQHTWMWSASGLILGVAILALFALFEKRRNDVLRLVENLRQWD